MCVYLISLGSVLRVSSVGFNPPSPRNPIKEASPASHSDLFKPKYNPSPTAKDRRIAYFPSMINYLDNGHTLCTLIIAIIIINQVILT